MFKENGSETSDLSKLSDDELLREYRSSQYGTEGMIDNRNFHEEMNKNPEAGYQDHHKSQAEDYQSRAEYGFTELNKLRAEIDKRGLSEDTMEEREAGRKEREELRNKRREIK